MGEQRSVLTYTGLTGRNGWDPPQLLGPTECADAVNVEFLSAGLGRKRSGGETVSLTDSTFTTSDISSLFTHEPSADLSAIELWAAAGTVLARRASSVWTVPTIKDALADAHLISAVSLDGKAFIAYKTSGNTRLHVWDGSTVRRTGLATAAAPTATNVGGASTFEARNYKVRYVEKSGTTYLRIGELGAALAFAQSPTTASITVTKPAAISEGETHWELFGTVEPAGTYKLLASTAVATATYSDTVVDPVNYTGTAAPVTGTYTNWEAVRYLSTDGNRLLGAGNFSTAAGTKYSRVWFSPILGTGTMDLERVPNTTDQKNWIDCDENSGGGITFLSRPIDGVIYVFKASQIHKLVPTGNAFQPYARYVITRSVGCFSPRAVVQAEDEFGRPALYFASIRGIYRLGSDGLQYLGYDNQDLWESLSVPATVVNNPAHAVFHTNGRHLWWWFTSTTPVTMLCFDVRLGRTRDDGSVRGGWSRFTGDITKALCSVMAPADTSMATTSPHLGFNSGGTAAALHRYDSGDTDDAGTAFQAYVTSPALAPYGFPVNHSLLTTHLLAKAGSGVDIQITATPDFSADTAKTATVSLTASGSETRVHRKADGLVGIQDVGVTQFTIGDSAAVSNAWTLDALVAVWERQAPR